MKPTIRNLRLDRGSDMDVKKSMKRVVVIGCPGAGKSIFAERLSRTTGLTLYNLDSLFWRAGGLETDREKWRKLQEDIAAGDSWIIEGNYGATIDVRLRQADTVIFMDFSTLRCLVGFLRRVIVSKLGLGRRHDLVEGCNTRLDAKLLNYVWTFNKKHRKGIVQGLSRYPDLTVVTLRSRKETESFLHRTARPF